MNEAASKLGPDDASRCMILELREGDSLICTVDVNQHQNVQAALAKAYSLTIEDTPLNNIPAEKEGAVVDIAYWTPGKGLLHHKAKVRHMALANHPSDTTIIKYANIEALYSHACGLEFRDIELPEEMLKAQTNKQACFRIKVSGELGVLCSTAPFRPVLQNRSLMKIIHNLCLEAQLEEGLISQQIALSPASEEPLPNKASSVLIGGSSPPAAQGQSTDPDLVDDAMNGFWKGNVHFIELGLSVSETHARRGLLTVGGRQIIFEEPETRPLKWNLLTLLVSCQSE